MAPDRPSLPRTNLTTRTTCRVCGSPELADVLSLGDQCIAGAFAEPSWVSIFFGQRVWPRRHDPMAELLHRDEVNWDLERRRNLVGGAARSLTTHGDFIARYCAST